MTEEPTLATKLGMTTHMSPLLRKARRLGMGPSELEALAVQRGCRHYSNGTEPEQLDHEVSLVIYGRAAIALGFANPPASDTTGSHLNKSKARWPMRSSPT